MRNKRLDKETKFYMFMIAAKWVAEITIIAGLFIALFFLVMKGISL